MTFEYKSPTLEKIMSTKGLTINEQGYIEKEPTKATIHKNIVLDLNKLYAAKNSDYGDSFAETRRRIPNAILIRLWDKILRLETLMNGANQQVKDESIDDTLKDLANYALMELVERTMENKVADTESVENKKCKYHDYGKTMPIEYGVFCTKKMACIEYTDCVGCKDYSLKIK